MNKQPFTHFDLPRQHLGDQGHYIPARAREEHEATWRRRVPRGTVLLKQQERGLRVLNYLIRNTEEESFTYSADIASQALLNGSWYLYGRNAPGMRRRLYMLDAFNRDTGQRESIADLKTKAVTNLGALVCMAEDLVLRSEASRPSQRAVFTLGRLAGSTALQFAVLKDNAVPGGNAYDAQEQIREISLEALSAARTSIDRTGAYISPAQLADTDSPWSVNFRTEAPDQAHNRFKEAHEILDFRLFSK